MINEYSYFIEEVYMIFSSGNEFSVWIKGH